MRKLTLQFDYVSICNAVLSALMSMMIQGLLRKIQRVGRPKLEGFATYS